MKMLAVAALAGALSLGACQSVPNIFSNLPALENLIITDAGLVCQFVPSAETVAQIVAAYVPGALPIEQTAEQIANQICTAVKNQTPAQSGKFKVTRGAVIDVNGKNVLVTGTFLK